MSTWLLVAAGGALGAMARWSLGILFASGGEFPWATLSINIAGSLAIGLVWGAWSDAAWFVSWGRALLVSGLLGGFTTYSAFSLETVNLLTSARTGTAFAYVAATVTGCLAAAWLGQRLTS